MGTPILQPTFTGGELSPSLYARVDLARYGTSLRTAKNFLVRPYGGVVNRAGLGFVGEVKNSATKVRLLPFEYSTEIAYVIELGHQYARFIYHGVYIESSPGVPAEVATPWTQDQLRDIAYTQSADVMYLVHPSTSPRELRRLTATSFELRAFSNKNGPFMAINPNEAIKVACSAETGAVTLTASSGIFSPDHVGALFYIEEKDLRGQRPWEAGWRGVSVGTLCRSDGKVYRCSAIPGGSPTYRLTGGTRPIHDSGRAWDGPQDQRTSGTDTYTVGVEWEYLHSGFGIVRITGYTSATVVTGVVASRIPASCVGGLGSPGNTWTLSGNGSTKTFTITGATSESESDYSVTIGGVPVQSNPDYTPPGGIGGGDNPWCPSVDAFVTVVVDGAERRIRAGDVKVGDMLVLFEAGDWSRHEGVVTHSQPRLADRVRLVTASGARLTCSTTAPIRTEAGLVNAPDTFGQRIIVRIDGRAQWSEVVDVEAMAQGWVQHITVGDREFWTGDDDAGDILHHNKAQT